jgi:hypothetical protein
VFDDVGRHPLEVERRIAEAGGLQRTPIDDAFMARVRWGVIANMLDQTP